MKYILCGEKEDFLMFEKKVNSEGIHFTKKENEVAMYGELKGEKFKIIKNWLVNEGNSKDIFGEDEEVFVKEKNKFGIKMINVER